MSYDKVTKAVNRAHDHRVVRNQTAIYLLYNDACWLSDSRVGQLRKVKAMNCSCGTCRNWAQEARRSRLKLQLRKAGMTKEWSDERPDIITDEHDDLVIREEDWI